jgi:hypothetical protein
MDLLLLKFAWLVECSSGRSWHAPPLVALEVNTIVFAYGLLLLLALQIQLVSSGLSCSICAHPCSTDVFTLCSSASPVYAALLEFCLNFLYLWFQCSYVPLALLFAL